MNQIGIDKKQAKKLAKELSKLLANYQIMYANVRGFHWNIKGDKFFELHVKFEELYNDLNLKVDEIAERILTLGYNPEYRYSQYAEVSGLKEVDETADGIKDVKIIVESFGMLLSMQRSIMELASEANDEGTASMMSDYIREQEKMVWMYTAFLNH